MNTIKWRAVYNDGSYLEQSDANGYADIDRARLASFCLFKGDTLIFQLVMKDGQRLIWRKRVIVTPGAGEQVWHLIGWQKTVAGENIQCIAYLSDDGFVLMAGEWEGEHALLGRVELLDFE